MRQYATALLRLWQGKNPRKLLLPVLPIFSQRTAAVGNRTAPHSRSKPGEGSETEIRFGAFGKGKYSSCRVRLPGQMNMEVSRLNFLRQLSGAFHGDRTVEKAVGMLPFLIPRYSSFLILHNSGNDHPHPSAPEQTESRPPQGI